MYVESLAETRVADRIYTLEATKGFGSAGYRNEDGARETVSYRVEIIEDREGAGTHDRVIVAIHHCASRFEAESIHRLLVSVALHHGPEPFAP